MATLLLLSPALGVHVSSHVWHCHSPAFTHPYSKKNICPKKARRSLDGWRGVLGLGWQRRSSHSVWSPLPCDAAPWS